jgi:hypothetical protein
MGKQIFDDFPEVDCNACECYYTNQCDGTPTGSEKPCKTFKAVRRVDIPLQIKAAQDGLERLRTVLSIHSVFQLILDVILILILITLSVR